jgi:hypothetical protein
MKKVAIIAIFIGALLVGGTLGFIITGFATSGSFRDSFNFYYEPSSPAPIEELLVNVDVGDVQIQYNSSDTPYYAKIEVSIAVSGLFMTETSYLDFFTPYTEWWDNTSTPTSFDMNVLPETWFNPSHWFKSYNIDIIITLRTDVVYNIDAHTITGSLKMNVPEDVILNDTLLQVTTGGVLLDTSPNTNFQGILNVQSITGSASVIGQNTSYSYGFSSGVTTGDLHLYLENCVLSHDLIGTVTTGAIFYTTYNLSFTQDSSINLQTTTGDINGNINQYEDLGANVTGNFLITTGWVNIVYVNDMSSIGTRFSSTFTTGAINYDYSTLEFSRINGILTSSNYNSALYKYTFTLSTVTGHINVDAESHHLI